MHFSQTNIPRIGVGVLVIDRCKILLGKRTNAHGNETWGAPGGHLEFGETPEICAYRELLEETGLIATDVQCGPWTNDHFQKDNKHYITLFMIVRKFQGNLELKEPDQCLSWEWFDLMQLPKPLFLPLQNLLKDGYLFE